MANTLYPTYKQGLLDPDAMADSNPVDMNTDAIKVALLSSAYTYAGTHAAYSQLSGVIGTPVALANKTVTDGVLDSDPVTFASVAAGSTVVAYVIFKDTGTAATSQLIGFFDHDGAGNSISLATNGNNITVTPNASGWFAL